MNLFSAAGDIMKGGLRVSDRKKYSAITVSIACVHICLIFVFLRIGSVPMSVYNVCSFLGYVLCLPLIKKNRLSLVFAYICVEVPLHSMLAIYTAGWEFGFAMYLIAIVPVGFDMSFALKNTVRGIGISMGFGLISFAVFISCRMFCYFNAPRYTVENNDFVRSVYFVNMFCTFALLLVYSFIFASEISAAQNDLRKKNSELARLASIDTLTGLYNRRKMHEFLRAAEEKLPYSLIMSDIDNFKRINDTYGHDCGDEALKMVSETLRRNMPDGDVVCRWGGEEFLILTRQSLEGAAELAEKIRADVESRRIKYGNSEICVTVTLGVSQYDNGSTIDKAITAADENLYIGKNSGKNRVVR